MPRRRAPFTQADIARALKGAASAGLRVARLEIDAEGKIVIISETGAPPPEPATEFDAWRAKRHARSA